MKELIILIISMCCINQSSLGTEQSSLGTKTPDFSTHKRKRDSNPEGKTSPEIPRESSRILNLKKYHKIFQKI